MELPCLVGTTCGKNRDQDFGPSRHWEKCGTEVAFVSWRGRARRALSRLGSRSPERWLWQLLRARCHLHCQPVWQLLSASDKLTRRWAWRPAPAWIQTPWRWSLCSRCWVDLWRISWSFVVMTWCQPPIGASAWSVSSAGSDERCHRQDDHLDPFTDVIKLFIMNWEFILCTVDWNYQIYKCHDWTKIDAKPLLQGA